MSYCLLVPQHKEQILPLTAGQSRLPFLSPHVKHFAMGAYLDHL
jgi:hypothetical protein